MNKKCLFFNFEQVFAHREESRANRIQRHKNDTSDVLISFWISFEFVFNPFIHNVEKWPNIL